MHTFVDRLADAQIEAVAAHYETAPSGVGESLISK
jgi:hypothetical protein